ncbi:hypothetical protein JW960_10865 [candidate division KSB1 bacterium]|nr:hypothetical protein [candidate division KSB1 bacterium]
MKLYRKVSTTLVMFAVTVNFALAQDISEYVSKYTSENGKGYLQPLGDAFGANLNSGFYHSANIPMVGLHVDIELVTMSALIGDDQKAFTATTEDLFSPAQTVEAPTIFGSSEGASVDGTGGTSYDFPPGFNMTMLPIAAPQLTVGSLFGSDITIRWVDLDLGENWGRLSLTGWGIRHSISQYIPLFPVDVAVGFYRQSFKVGDIVDANATFLSAQASITRGIFTIYGGLGTESSNLDIAYTFEDAEISQTVSFELKAENSVRMTVGFALNAGPLMLHTDFNIASQKVLVLGIGVGI